MKWPICLFIGRHVTKDMSRPSFTNAKMQSNPIIYFWSQSFKAVDFCQLVCSDALFTQTQRNFSIQILLHKKIVTLRVRIASFWKEAVLLQIGNVIAALPRAKDKKPLHHDKKTWQTRWVWHIKQFWVIESPWDMTRSYPTRFVITV